MYLGLCATYVGWVIHGCVRPDWKSAGRGLLGLGWAFVDLAAILTLIPIGHGIWLIQVDPVTSSGLEGVVLGFVFITALFAVPLLVPAGMEFYYRLRSRAAIPF